MSLRVRRKELGTLCKSWQASCFVDVAKTLAGRARFLRRVAFLGLELEDDFAWPVQHFV